MPRKYTRKPKGVKAKPEGVKVIPPKPQFVYGDIILKGKIVYQYEPNRILSKFYFRKFDILIEADDIKEAKEKIKERFE